MTWKPVVLLTLGIGAATGATLPDNRSVAPTAVARISGGEYCFAHDRRVDVEREPPSWLALRVRIQVAYHNPGARPIIIPIEHDRTVYTALQTGVMNVYREPITIDDFNPSLKPMIELPPTVSRDNPVSPKNDEFAVLPAGGNFVSSQIEEVTFPVNHKTLFRHYPDLRGKKLYIRLQLNQQEMNPSLLTDLSDRWNKFGVPWTGEVMTNVMTVQVPRNPAASSVCIDSPFEHPGNKLPDAGK